MRSRRHLRTRDDLSATPEADSFDFQDGGAIEGSADAIYSLSSRGFPRPPAAAITNDRASVQEYVLSTAGTGTTSVSMTVASTGSATVQPHILFFSSLLILIFGAGLVSLDHLLHLRKRLSSNCGRGRTPAQL